MALCHGYSFKVEQLCALIMCSFWAHFGQTQEKDSACQYFEHLQWLAWPHGAQCQFRTAFLNGTCKMYAHKLFCTLRIQNSQSNHAHGQNQGAWGKLGGKCRPVNERHQNVKTTKVEIETHVQDFS